MGKFDSVGVNITAYTLELKHISLSIGMNRNQGQKMYVHASGALDEIIGPGIYVTPGKAIEILQLLTKVTRLMSELV